MAENYVFHNPDGGCDVCGRTTDQMWQCTLAGFINCDVCRRRSTRDTFVRVK